MIFQNQIHTNWSKNVGLLVAFSVGDVKLDVTSSSCSRESWCGQVKTCRGWNPWCGVAHRDSLVIICSILHHVYSTPPFFYAWTNLLASTYIIRSPIKYRRSPQRTLQKDIEKIQDAPEPNGTPRNMMESHRTSQNMVEWPRTWWNILEHGRTSWNNPECSGTNPWNMIEGGRTPWKKMELDGRLQSIAEGYRTFQNKLMEHHRT